MGNKERPVQRPMRALVYKRTHAGDPGIGREFGINTCMGRVRGFPFDVVIGIGGTSRWPQQEGIAGKLTWVGRNPRRSPNPHDTRGPLVSFGADDFRLFDQQGPLLHLIAPLLSKRMYGHRSSRYAFDSFSPAELEEIKRLVSDVLDHGQLNHLRLDAPSTFSQRQCKKSRQVTQSQSTCQPARPMPRCARCQPLAISLTNQAQRDNA